MAQKVSLVQSESKYRNFFYWFYECFDVLYQLETQSDLFAVTWSIGLSFYLKGYFMRKGTLVQHDKMNKVYLPIFC